MSSSSLSDLESALRRKRSEFDRKVGEYVETKRSVVALEQEVASASQQIVLYGKVLAVFHAMSVSVQEAFLSNIERLVTSGIQSVFGTGLAFKILPSVKAKSVVFDFVVTEKGKEFDPLDARGGGLVSLISLIMRVVVVRLMADTRRQILVLDEPLAALSREYAEPAAVMLKGLAHDLDMQLLVVTHNEEIALAADTVYRMTKDDSGFAQVVTV